MPIGISSTTTEYVNPKSIFPNGVYPAKRIFVNKDDPEYPQPLPDIQPFSFHRYLESSEMPRLTFSEYNGSFSYFGHDADVLVQRAAEFCRKTARIEGNIEQALTAFFEHLRTAHLQPFHTALWLSVRVSSPGNSFDLPHWHHDGEYFTMPADQPPAFKVGTVIAGPATYFLTASKCNSLLCTNKIIQDTDYYARLTESKHSETSAKLDRWAMRRDEVEIGTKEHAICREKWVRRYRRAERIGLASTLQKIPFVTASPGEAVRWVVGNSELAAPHSEPPFTASRLFVSVLPGTTEQIKELCDAWGQTFGEFQAGKKSKTLEEEYAFISVTTPFV